MRGWSAVLLIAGLCAQARGGDLREEARLHYELGRLAYQQQRWTVALEEFKRAYNAAPLPDLLYNIGHTEEQLGRRKDAAASYRHFLAARPDAPERAGLEARIESLDAAPKPVPVPTVLRLEQPGKEQGKEQALGPPLANPAPTPIYRRWWLWTAVGGAVAVGLGVGLGVGLTRSESPSLGFPAVTVR